MGMGVCVSESHTEKEGTQVATLYVLTMLCVSRIWYCLHENSQKDLLMESMFLKVLLNFYVY